MTRSELRDTTRAESAIHGKAVMNKAIALALVVGGVVLMVLGINAMNSFSSDLSRLFTGSPTDKAVGLLIGGILATLIGLVGLLRHSKKA